MNRSSVRGDNPRKGKWRQAQHGHRKDGMKASWRDGAGEGRARGLDDTGARLAFILAIWKQVEGF